MAKIPNSLDKSVDSYPIFQHDQVLTADQLRNIVDYLDQQSRLTRVSLIGSGIVCGLLPRRDSDALVISPGCGVTSEGFLIHRDRESRMERLVQCQIALGDFLGTDQSDPINAEELFEVAGGQGDPLPAAFFDTPKVIVLLLECKDETKEICVDDCDKKGTNRKFRVRTIAIEPAVAEDVLQKNYRPQDLPGSLSLGDLFSGKYGLPDLYLERFGYTAAEGDNPALATLNTITDYETFLKRYRDIISSGAARVIPALALAHKMFSPIFSSFVPGSEAIPGLPSERFQNARDLDLQYLYDHLRDLISAYDEFREVAFDLMDVGGAKTTWFPKHLFVGQILNGGEHLPIPPAVDRTPFFQPPVYNGNPIRVEAARLLFVRLKLLIDSFIMPPVLNEKTPIKITPSKYGDAPLSSRAIPYYYDPRNILYQSWSGDRHRKGNSHQIYSYHRLPATGDAPNPRYGDPLVYDFEAQNFFRIEGHVGLELTTAFGRIQELRQQYNLPFDVAFLKLGDGESADYQNDCEIEILEAQYTKLRTDLKCALEHGDGNFGDLLKDLTENLDDFKFANFEHDFGKASQNKNCLFGYDKDAFKKLAELHGRRKEEVLKLRLFHGFAQAHPGMEHRAGVPRGGTFILLYRDRPKTNEELASELRLILGQRDLTADEREKMMLVLRQPVQQVVADFCLPYLCCSDCPPATFILARPRPTLLLEETSFCANDSQRYSFIVSPTGGVLVGLGTNPNDYSFVPSKTGILQGTVEVTYAVDGVEAKLIITILSVPNASFAIQPMPPNQDSFNFQIDSISPPKTVNESYHYVYEYLDFAEQAVRVEKTDSKAFELSVPKQNISPNQQSFVLKLVVGNGPCQGESFSKDSRIKRGPNNRLAEPVDLSDNARSLLKQRSGKRLDEIVAIAQPHEGLADTSSFKAVQKMMMTLADSSNEELVAQYKEVLLLNLRAFNQTDEPGRKEAYRELIENATVTLLDGMASKAADDAPQSTAIEQFNKLRESGFDLEAVWKAWRTDDIGNTVDRTRLDAIDALKPPDVA